MLLLERKSTWPFNQRLVQEKRLILPRIEDASLLLYQVEDFAQLTRSSAGILEPNPSLCAKIPLSAIQTVLVPGLAFDAKGFRLGYGKGYYDRLLSNQAVRTLGLGFLEQKMETELLREPWDVPLTALLLT